MKLRVYQRVQMMQALGPGLRYGLWVQGCSRRCEGCASPMAQPLGGGELMDVGELAEEILKVQQIEGITVSGGEPLLQADALYELLAKLKSRRDIGVLLYSGFRYEEIAGRGLLKWCDVLIDGEYVASLDDGKSLRGSSNQRIFYLSDRYKKHLDFGASSRSTEFVKTTDGRIVLVGIPSVEDMEMGRKINKFFEEGD